jgi:RNA polymerase sigma factor (sigma-70 family)
VNKEYDKEYWQIVWNRYRLGDQEAFAILYNLHIDHLYHYGTKLCKDSDAVKDSLQELFLELFLNRERIRTTPENLKYYLMLSLKRNLVRKLKAGKLVTHYQLKSLVFEPEYNIEFKIIEQESEKEIHNTLVIALQKLTPKQKEAIYLRFDESLEYKEIANILEITVESVRKQIHRAIKTIREIIKTKPISN